MHLKGGNKIVSEINAWAPLCPICFQKIVGDTCNTCGILNPSITSGLKSMAIKRVMLKQIKPEAQWLREGLSDVITKNMNLIINNCPNTQDELKEIGKEIEEEARAIIEETKESINHFLKSKEVNIELNNESIAIIAIMELWLKESEFKNFISWQRCVEFIKFSEKDINSAFQKENGENFYARLGNTPCLYPLQNVDINIGRQGDQFSHHYFVKKLTPLKNKPFVIGVRDDTHIPNTKIFIFLPEE